MQHESERDTAWEGLNRAWDVVVVGGGIVGAGIYREAVRLGLRSLLVEQRDFAWGTSSRSSKFVHGGLRYLKDLDIRMARQSVRGRRQLLRDAPGLVNPIEFLLTRHKGDHPGKLGYQVILNLYDLLAGQRIHHHYTIEQLRLLSPGLGEAFLVDSFACAEAQTDDARLTIRIIYEGTLSGGCALNYVRAEQLIRTGDQVAGVTLRDRISGRSAEVETSLVVNATGAWADQLRSQMVESRMMRPQRGSHLVFPGWRVPVTQNVTINHPIDRRPISIFPWHTVTLVGSTDIDHDGPLDEEPHIAPHEVAYLMAAVDYAFPGLNLTLADVTACFSGVRPIVSTGKVNPSKESRDHLIVYERGLLTITGGKLTTFQDMAIAGLHAVPHEKFSVKTQTYPPALDPIRIYPDLLEPVRTRLLGRYGNVAVQVAAAAQPGELDFIPGTNVLWIELRWAARREAVIHLDDLLLRRVAIGILLPQGGRYHLNRIRAVCQAELQWDDQRWHQEQENYCTLIDRCYSLPDPQKIPDWKDQVRKAREH